jgi:hypothetical protein
MVRTQIQLPDPLYKQVKEIAKLEDWSVAEVIRRGAERMVKSYPALKRSGEPWQFPPPLKGRKLLVSDPSQLKQLAQDDAWHGNRP